MREALIKLALKRSEDNLSVMMKDDDPVPDDGDDEA